MPKSTVLPPPPMSFPAAFVCGVQWWWRTTYPPLRKEVGKAKDQGHRNNYESHRLYVEVIVPAARPVFCLFPSTRPVHTMSDLEVSHSYSLFFDDSGVCNAPCVVFVHQGGGWRDRYTNAATFVRVGYLARTNRSKLSE